MARLASLVRSGQDIFQVGSSTCIVHVRRIRKMPGKFRDNKNVNFRLWIPFSRFDDRFVIGSIRWCGEKIGNMMRDQFNRDPEEWKLNFNFNFFIIYLFSAPRGIITSANFLVGMQNSSKAGLTY